MSDMDRAAAINDALEQVEGILKAVSSDLGFVICVQWMSGPASGAGAMSSNVEFQDSLELIGDVVEHTMKAMEQQDGPTEGGVQ